MDVADWLRALGLERYEASFRENDVDADLLPKLTADDLKDLGVTSLGHRRRLLDAIAALRLPTDHPVLPGDSLGSPQTVAERRPLTVLFCDLIGSTALSARLDPEDLREIIRTYQTCVATTIQQFDGFVTRYMGDGVLIYFGWPQARETDAERAVRGALAVAEAVGATPVGGEKLQVRIGIATGLVVVGELMGTDDWRQQTAIGETPNLAARLQALAGPNQVVIDAATRRQIGGLFECEHLGTVDLKGLPAAVPAWQVLSENRTLGQFEALRSGATRFVGRDDEVELLLDRWAQAKAGNGGAVLISGEAGVGKSRLAEALSERIAAEPHFRMSYFCSPHHQDSAFYPVIAQMERAAGFNHLDGPPARLAKLQALLATTEPTPEDVALIASLHGLPTADLAPALDVTPQRKKEKTFEALLRRVEGLSRQLPVLAVFDDLHWADPSLRELLDRTMEWVTGRPILLLALFRPEFQPPWHRHPHVTQLTLGRLDRHNTTAMVASVAGDATLSADIVEEIVERTDGVPLFVEELTKVVLESGAQAPATLSALPRPGLSVPATLHASLIARLDRLGPTAKDVAQTGAAIGREFGHDLLASVIDLPEPQLHQALDRLTGAELLFVRGAQPQLSYLFKHALVQDAAYGTLLRGRRQLLHRRIAASLEERFPEVVVAQPALLAQHCAAAGLAEKSVFYWLKAGQQALARPAITEAVTQLRRGLDALADLPDGPSRRQQELDLQLALGSALAAKEGIAADGVGATITQARALAEQMERPQYLVPLIFGQWRFRSVRSEHRLALSHAEELATIGGARNDVAAQLMGHRAHGQTSCYLGDFAAARSRLEQCLALSDPAHRTIGGGLSDDPYATMLANLGVALAYLGHLDQAQSRLDAALSEARRLNHAITLATVLTWANWTELITGSPALDTHVEELRSVASERGFPFHLAYAMVLRAPTLMARGQAEEAVALLTRGLAAIRATGAVAATPVALMWTAEAHAMLGRQEDGLACLAEAERTIETTEERCHEAELHRVRGNFLQAAGDPAGAERSYQHSLAVARSQSARLLELRGSISLARLWVRQDRHAEAGDALATIYNWFTEGLSTPILREAKALLEQLRQ